VIEGLDASDLFSLNSVIGGTIEVQTVSTLNRIRNVWDPDNDWADYGFERFSQTFPDVRLVNRRDVTATPVLGMELKGWYLLAKEKALRPIATPRHRMPAQSTTCWWSFRGIWLTSSRGRQWCGIHTSSKRGTPLK
jgi:hypothetical protein